MVSRRLIVPGVSTRKSSEETLKVENGEKITKVSTLV